MPDPEHPLTGVLIADADPVLRTALRGALEPHGFVVLAEAATAEQVVAASLRHRPSLVLLDRCLPGPTLTVVRIVSDALPLSRVVVLARTPAGPDLFQCIRAGARGYLPRDIDRQRLPRVLDAVLSGEAAVPRRLVTGLVAAVQAAPAAGSHTATGPLAALTAAELRVVELLSRGLSTGQIAEELFVAPVTVRSHIAAALHKLHVPDRAAAVALLDTCRASDSHAQR